jgi:hypothetical protein
MNEYTKQAAEFLEKASAYIEIDFAGRAINRDWKESTPRNLYSVTISTPRGSMTFDFWDSIYNTEITEMNAGQYAEKRYNRRFDCLTPYEKNLARKELQAKKAAARPGAYDVIACMQKYDPGTFENFCSEFGYDEDSRAAERIYFACQNEYSQLAKIFTPEQLEEMQEIN